MPNKFGIPEMELLKIRTRDKNCVYCRKTMVYPCVGNQQRDWATIEHLRSNAPFYWKDGLKALDVVICCGSCNSSRGVKELTEWFTTPYCLIRDINEKTVANPVRTFLEK